MHFGLGLKICNKQLKSQIKNTKYHEKRKLRETMYVCLDGFNTFWANWKN